MPSPIDSSAVDSTRPGRLTELCEPPKGCAARNGGRCRGKVTAAEAGRLDRTGRASDPSPLAALLISCDCAGERPRRPLPEGWHKTTESRPNALHPPWEHLQPDGCDEPCDNCAPF